MDAGQTWFLVTLVGKHIPSHMWTWLICATGLCIGVNAAIISITTEWLSDIKMGYCSDGWWLNQQFCCWEIEVTEGDASCDSWRPWSNLSFARWVIYILFAVLLLASPLNLKGPI